MVHNTNIATHAFMISLKPPYSGNTTTELVANTGLPKTTINNIYAQSDFHMVRS